MGVTHQAKFCSELPFPKINTSLPIIKDDDVPCCPNDLVGCDDNFPKNNVVENLSGM
jgi:hypothetical protein